MAEVVADTVELFQRLHEGPDVLLLPNAWDVASAKLIEQAGYKAMGTTSAAVAFALGYPDGEKIGRDEMIEVCGRIARSVRIPVTFDLEAGYGTSADAVAKTVRAAIEAGAAGVNIEDGTGDDKEPLLPLPLAIDRIRAARAAADEVGVPIVINARTDGFLCGRLAPEHALSESISRANRYREVGAGCLFVPGPADPGVIGKLVKAIDGPLNLLARANLPALPVLKSLGVRRVSLGSGLASACWAVIRTAAQELHQDGTFNFLRGAVTHSEMTKLMTRRE